MNTSKRFVFPRWTTLLRDVGGLALLGGPLYVVVLVWTGFSPKTTDVGYMPKQPVPYSHAVHVGQLGLDCRYCHTTVENAAHSMIPPTEVCMTCHTNIRNNSPKLQPVFESYKTGKPIEWVKVHDLPDYVYFNHSAHVNAGVGCVECHGRVDKMEEVYQFAPLSMGWCLDCHRAPETRLRPKELVTQMDWKPAATDNPQETGKRLIAEYHLNPQVSCAVCHR